MSSYIYLEVAAHVSLKVATRGSLREKKLWTFRFLGYISKTKTEKCEQIFYNVFHQFGITIPCTARYSLEVAACVSLKVATKVSLRSNKTQKFYFLGYFSEAKTKKCDQKVSNIFDQFGITIPCSATYFLGVGARVSL